MQGCADVGYFQAWENASIEMAGRPLIPQEVNVGLGEANTHSH